MYLLNVVVAQSPAILQLLTSEDESLRVWWNTFLVLDLRFHVVDRIRRLYFQCDCLARQCLDEDLHSTTESMIRSAIFHITRIEVFFT
jgi:hypothetical protein